MNRVIASPRMRATLAALLGAAALAAGFPKANASWLVPFGAAALFWAWQSSSLKRAILLGWIAGLVFFTLDYSWVGYTVSHYVGAFGPFVPIGPGLIESPFFALAGGLAWLSYSRVKPSLAPVAAAAAFTICEWLRSIGVLGAPFDQLGYTQADGPLRAIAAFAGTYGVTFALCVLGAYLADAAARRTWRPLAMASACVAAVAAAAWIEWPARTLPPPAIPVAAIQGNIEQSLKWDKNTLPVSIDRYTMLTREAMRAHPKLIVWPETVITERLTYDPMLVRTFADLSREANATIVAGALSAERADTYDSLFIFSTTPKYEVYNKRQLVPFAEHFPGESFLWWVPYVGALNSRITPGVNDGVYQTDALPIAPLICWESAFSDLAYAQVRNGAKLFVVSTDDAWFGPTSGPYMHAQIAQLRAIEFGTYVVRAAATGVSGIIAPNGQWTQQAGVGRQAVVLGNVGPPAPTAFSRLGPTPVMLTIVLLYAALTIAVTRRAR